ncbi:MAG: hypothetical protein WAV13_11855, partial [Thermodesulfovibrionales bacterium]
TLDGVLYEQASVIDKAIVDPQTGMPIWKYLLDEHHVEYVVIPCSADSRSFPLCQALKGDRGWFTAFSDQTSAIFVRNAGVN